MLEAFAILNWKSVPVGPTAPRDPSCRDALLCLQGYRHDAQHQGTCSTRGLMLAAGAPAAWLSGKGDAKEISEAKKSSGLIILLWGLG